jgi:CBS domain-containing protein
MTTRPPVRPSATDPSTARLAARPEVLDDDPQVTTVMTTRVVAIAAEARMPTALHLMTTAGVRLVEADLIRRLAQAPGPPSAALALTAGDLRRPTRELPPTARASDAARQMSLDAADAVLVTDHGRILGIVTATDLVRMLARAVS